MKLAVIALAVFVSLVATKPQGSRQLSVISAVTFQDQLFDIVKDLLEEPTISAAVQADASLAQIADVLKQETDDDRTLLFPLKVQLALQLLNSLAQAFGLVTTTTAATTTTTTATTTVATTVAATNATTNATTVSGP